MLLADRYDAKNFEAWWQRENGRTAAVEAALNHLHLWDVFDPEPEGVPGRAVVDLANVIGACWKARLKQAFPGRDFAVLVSDGSDDYGPTVAFQSSTP